MLRTRTPIAIITTILFAATLHAQGITPTRLNQFVVELADLDLQDEDAPDALGGVIDEPGWLFIALRGEGEATVTLSADGAETVVLDGPGETMRHVGAGEIRLELTRGDGANLERPSCA